MDCYIYIYIIKYYLGKKLHNKFILILLIFPFLHTVDNAFGSSKTFYKLLIHLCQLIKWMS